MTLMTARGERLEATLHVPSAPSGLGVVLAPGRGYHRALPLLRRTAEALSDEAGAHVVRFDWAFFTASREPSPDRSDEADDLDAAVRRVHEAPGVRRIVLAGKSLGSVAVARRAVEQRDPDLAGLVLFTLPLHHAGDPTTPWPGADVFARVDVPTLIVNGDADPLSDLGHLLATAATFARPPRLVIVPGGHDLGEADGDEGLDLAIRATVLWTRRFGF